MSYKIDYAPQTFTQAKFNGQAAFRFNPQLDNGRPDQYLVSKDLDGQWKLVGDSAEIGTRVEDTEARQNFGLWSDTARCAGGILFWKHDARELDKLIQPDEVLSLGQWQKTQKFTSSGGFAGNYDIVRKNKLTSVELSASDSKEILLNGEWRASDSKRYGVSG